MKGWKIIYSADGISITHISGKEDKNDAIKEAKSKTPRNTFEFKIISATEIEVQPKKKGNGKPPPFDSDGFNFLKNIFGI